MVMHGSTKYIPQHIKEQRAIQALTSAPPVAVRPNAPKIRAEVEPPTSNLTLYGETPAPFKPSPADPQSYKPGDWRSVTHSQFQPLPYVAESKEIQNQRARFQMSSDLPLNEESAQVFNPSVGFAGKETQFKTDFRPLEREWYVNRPGTYAIGTSGASQEPNTVGLNTNKAAPQSLSTNPNAGRITHSDVHIKETDKMEPHLYESLTKRQYLPYPIDKDVNRIDKARRWENKKDMVASHFVIGTDAQHYDTAAKVHLPSEKPLVKNQTLYYAPRDPDHNPYIARGVADARPTNLSPKEVAYRKAASSVPVLTKNNPEYYQYGGAWPDTSTQYATPSWNPNRQPGWQLEGNGLGGVKLGHDEKYAYNGDGSLSPSSHRREMVSPQEDQLPQGSQPAGGMPSRSTPTPTFGRRSVTPLLAGASSAGTSAQQPSDTMVQGASALDASSARARNTDPRWISATKASYKGYQYK